MPIAGGPGSPIYPGTPPGVTAKLGSGNIYGDTRQCTWYADERYHQLTGYWVPWAADALGWLAGAQQSGWDSASQPPNAPSIIVLQPGVQLANPVYGHVGVVEKVNPDGSVTTSNLNWGPTPSAKSAVSTVVFRTGPGVNFVWVGVGGQPAQGTSNQGGPGASQTLSNLPTFVSTTLQANADVASSLVALDIALELTNPFDTSGSQINDISILGQDTGVPNPIQWTADVATNMIHLLSAAIIRGLCLFVGALILYKVASAFIDFGALAETAQAGRESLVQLAKAGILG